MVTIRVVTTRWNSSGVRSPGLSVPPLNNNVIEYFRYSQFDMHNLISFGGPLRVGAL